MYYGAQYFRPPFPRKKDWERDFANMESYGFNYVKLWAVWNFIEKSPDEFDFADLDELVALAKSHHLKVIMNTIPEGAPYWTYDGRDENLYETADGQKVKYGGPANIPSGGWPGLCMDNPAFAKQVANFIEKTAEHFAGEESVACIDVWNEPHLEPMYDYRSNMLCYCDNTKTEFRKWLQNKYETLENLNTAWYRTYTDWKQVTPPPRFGTWADMLDWRRFWLDNMNRWLKIRVDACKRGAPGMPVQTHVAYSGLLGNRIVGGLGNELGDEFGLARGVDIFGLSSFPKWLMGEEHKYRHLIHSEMIACAARDKDFYQVELQGGGGKPGLLGGEVPSADDVRIWNYNTIAAGGKGSVYWQYAPEPAGIESPGFGLVGFKEEETPRSRMAGTCAKKLNTELLDEAKRVPVVNAIYVSRDSDLLCFAGDRKEEMYAGSLSGVFKACYEKGIAVTFLHQDYIEDLSYPQIECLYLPMALVLSDREKEYFKRFVQAGGTLVSEACPGLYQPDGLLETEGKVLADIFGLEHVEIQAAKEWGEVQVKEKDSRKEFTGRFYRQLIKPLENVKILAAFDDGEIAMTERTLGKGKAIWIGTYPSYHYEHTRDKKNLPLLAANFHQTGYQLLDSIQMNYTKNDQLAEAPVVRLLQSKDKYLLVAVNHCESPAQISVKTKEQNVYTVNLEKAEGRILEISI